MGSYSRRGCCEAIIEKDGERLILIKLQVLQIYSKWAINFALIITELLQNYGKQVFSSDTAYKLL